MNRKVLITGATGDTGRAAVKESIEAGLNVRALVRRIDDRSAALEKLGAQVVVGDLQNLDEVRAAMEGVDAAYLVYPVARAFGMVLTALPTIAAYVWLVAHWLAPHG